MYLSIHIGVRRTAFNPHFAVLSGLKLNIGWFLTLKLGFLKVTFTLFQSTVFTPDDIIGVDAPEGLVATDDPGVDSIFVRLVLESLRFTMFIL